VLVYFAVGRLNFTEEARETVSVRDILAVSSMGREKTHCYDAIFCVVR
jgi:hypothetical protein